VEVDGGPEVNAGQEVELEVDCGQGLGHGQGLEVNGRQEVEVELDGVQDVEQDVDSGQGVNRRRRRVGDYICVIDEYAMGGIRLQSRRRTCRHQVYYNRLFICTVYNTIRVRTARSVLVLITPGL
jgi:hypothetical protein